MWETHFPFQTLFLVWAFRTTVRQCTHDWIHLVTAILFGLYLFITAILLSKRFYCILRPALRSRRTCQSPRFPTSFFSPVSCNELWGIVCGLGIS
jgi:hypothetical protein